MLSQFHPHHFLRLLVIILIGVFAAQYSPVIEATIPNIANPLFGIIIFVFLSGFLINQTMDRNKALDVSVSLELSRTRRIAHIVGNMSATEKWKKDVRKSVVAYLDKIGMNDLSEYMKSQEEFRKITHAIYSFKPKTERDKILFTELLNATRDLAHHRQELGSHLHSPISPYTWVSFLLVGVIDMFLVLVIRESGPIATVYVASVVIIILLVVDILVDLNVFSRHERKEYQDMYVENAKRIRSE